MSSAANLRSENWLSLAPLSRVAFRQLAISVGGGASKGMQGDVPSESSHYRLHKERYGKRFNIPTASHIHDRLRHELFEREILVQLISVGQAFKAVWLSLKFRADLLSANPFLLMARKVHQ